jgi:hypothetical protein
VAVAEHVAALAEPLEFVGTREHGVDAGAAALAGVVVDLERLAVDVDERAELRRLREFLAREEPRRVSLEAGELVGDDGLNETHRRDERLDVR